MALPHLRRGLFMPNSNKNRLFQLACFAVFGLIITACGGGANCSDADTPPPTDTSYTGGDSGYDHAPYLPVTNEVAMEIDGLLYTYDIQENTRRTVFEGPVKSFSQPMLANKGKLITVLWKEGDKPAYPTLVTAIGIGSLRRLLTTTQVGHPCLDPSGNAGYALIPAMVGSDTKYRIYKVYPDDRTPEMLTDGSTNVLSPSIAPDGRHYTYARQVSGFRNEIYLDSLDNNTDAGVLVYSPPAGHSVGLPFWGQENGHDRIFFQLNYPDGNSAIMKVNLDGSNWAVLKSTEGGGLNGSPIQIANGRIVFHCADAGSMDIWSMLPDGTDPVNHTKSPGLQEHLRLFFES